MDVGDTRFYGTGDDAAAGRHDGAANVALPLQPSPLGVLGREGGDETAASETRVFTFEFAAPDLSLSTRQTRRSTPEEGHSGRVSWTGRSGARNLLTSS